MDRETIERVAATIRDGAEQAGIEATEVVVFGSRARDDYRPGSDVDVLIVSADFEGQRNYERPKPFYRAWDYESLPDPEFICLTPDEFEEQKRLKPHVVRTAVREGVSVVE